MSPLTALFERPSSERPSSERPSFGTPSAHSQRWLARVTAPLFFIASHAMAESNAGVKCDFNGDFAPDLAFSVPGETVAGLVLSGGINVQMLAPNLATVLAQHLQDGDELHPTPVAGTRVAGALACGDFDADGYGDLAIGIPERDEGEGMVTVIFGGPAGLDANLTHHLWQGKGGIPGTREASDRFGQTLTVGDFDGNGVDDLAIGAPFDADDLGLGNHSGSATIIFGLLWDKWSAELWNADIVFGGSPETYCATGRFGTALAAGNFNGQGGDELAVGAPGCDWFRWKLGFDADTIKGAGAVFTYSYVDAVVKMEHSGSIDRYSEAVVVVPNGYQEFGAALAVGYFTQQDSYIDLAIGAPGYDEGKGASTKLDVGLVGVVSGSVLGFGPGAVPDTWLQQSDFGDTRVSFDRFGEVLVAGRFDGDGFTDLAIGAPREDVGLLQDAGKVFVVYGRTLLPWPSGPKQVLYPGVSNIPGVNTTGNRFGAALATIDVGLDGAFELVVGAPGANPGAIKAGSATVIKAAVGQQLKDGVQFMQSQVPVLSKPAINEAFGSAIAN